MSTPPPIFPHQLNDGMLLHIMRAAYVKGFMHASAGHGGHKDKLVDLIMAHQSAKLNINCSTDVPGLMDPWTDEQIEEAHRLVYRKGDA